MTTVFQKFLQAQNAPAPLEAKKLQSLAKQALPEDVRLFDLEKYGTPAHHYYWIGKSLTEALLFDKEGNLTEKTIALLQDPSLRPYLVGSNSRIVLRISKLIEEKRQIIALKKKKQALQSLNSNNEDNSSGTKLTDIGFQNFCSLSITLEGDDEKAQENALTNFIANYNAPNPSDALDFCYQNINPELHWAFLNTLHRNYENTQLPTLPKNINIAIHNHDTTLDKMTSWTRWQSWGMWGAGFCFGIEVVLIVLEKIALQDFDDELSTEEMAGILLASCMFSCGILGSFTGDFFVGAHYNELFKQNCENYFNKHFQELKKPQETEPGETRARWGTILEGLLVFRGLLGAAAFVIFDLSILAAKGGDYENNIPGVYSFEQLQAEMDHDIGFGILLGVFATLMLTSIGWSAYSLTAGHYALDGKGMIEYCQEKEIAEKQSVSIGTGKQMLFFKPTFAEKVTGFLSSRP